jgi:hypothetical protein
VLNVLARVQCFAIWVFGFTTGALLAIEVT